MENSEAIVHDYGESVAQARCRRCQAPLYICSSDGAAADATAAICEICKLEEWFRGRGGEHTSTSILNWVVLWGFPHLDSILGHFII